MLLVGLGNPGNQYAGNRHNVGFMAVQEILRRHFSSVTLQKKFKGEYAAGDINGHKVHILMPQTYMNNSGESVRAAIDFFKIAPEDVVVIHDELDLELGDVRVKQGGGHAGHNGLRSLIQHLGTPNFRRIRFGVGHPGNKDLVTPYVLGNFRSEETSQVEKLCDAIADALPNMAAGDWKINI